MIAKFVLTTDKLLGLLGGGLAVGSASFGVFMVVHGPVSTAPGHDFTVFAQLVPRAHAPSTSGADLDTTATASIPKASADNLDVPAKILPGIVLRSSNDYEADIAIDGRLRRVRVGDTIPGAGELLEIMPGGQPVLRTTMGLIVSQPR